MMSTVQEVKDIIERAANMPWGPSCSAELARAVLLIDSLEGEEELRIETYLQLATAYQQGNEEWKALAPTAWLITKFDENPSAFDADQIESLAWLYKNAASATGRNPAVSKEKHWSSPKASEHSSRSRAIRCMRYTESVSPSRYEWVTPRPPMKNW